MNAKDPSSGHAGLRRRLARLLAARLPMGPTSRDELVDLLRQARKAHLMDGEALSMMEGVLQVSELRVRDIMVPRAHMVVVERDWPLDDILPVVIESAHSRFPVIGDDRAEVVGLLLAKDLLQFCGSRAEAFSMRNVLRPAVFVPESKRLNVLLKEFRRNRSHMAIVVDEYASAAGLVTIEDVLEQIVGEIEDEYDYEETPQIFLRDDNCYTAKARTTIEAFNEFFKSDLPTEEFDTIGGLVVNRLGHMPKRGETVEIDGFRFTVLRADSRRVRMLSIERLPESSDAQT